MITFKKIFKAIKMVLRTTQTGGDEGVENDLGPVVRRVDNFIQQVNPYLVVKIGAFLILIGQRTNFIRWIKLSTLRTSVP